MVEAARAASVSVQTVTQSSKDADDAKPFVLRTRSGGKGKEWGSAVHRVIEAYLRGRRDATLHAFARAVARDERLSPTLDAELLALVESAEVSAWSTGMPAGATIMTESTVMRHVTHGSTAVVVEGVIDAAVLQDGAWSIVDWKSDSVDAAKWSRRAEAYRRYVETYCNLLHRGTPPGVQLRGRRCDCPSAEV